MIDCTRHDDLNTAVCQCGWSNPRPIILYHEYVGPAMEKEQVRQQLAKLSPLAEWTTRDVWQYAEAHAIPLLSLYDQGYTSIGCQPCTSLPFDPADPRSGRWSGQKLECGIHIQAS